VASSGGSSRLRRLSGPYRTDDESSQARTDQHLSRPDRGFFPIDSGRNGSTGRWNGGHSRSATSPGGLCLGQDRKGDWSLAGFPGAADADGDGDDDLAVVAWEFTGGVAVFTDRIYPGSSSGPSATATASNLGSGSLASAGDVNSDGYEDMVARFGFANQGIVLGTASGLSASALALTTPPGWNGSQFASGYGPVGDVNRDGYDDIAVGDYSSMPGMGQFWVYFGGATFDPNADTTYTGTGAAGSSVCGGGDVNGDAIADFADGAPGETGTASTSGRAHLFYGASGTVNTTADIIVSGETSSEYFGVLCSL